MDREGSGYEDPQGKELDLLEELPEGQFREGVEAVKGRVIEVDRGSLHPEKGSGLNSEITACQVASAV